MITGYTQKRFGPLVEVAVTTDLTGVIYYHWWVDGQYVGMGAGPVRSFYLESGEQARITCVATNMASYDPYANPPDRFPPRRLVWWIRSLASDVARYRVEQKKTGGDWTAIGIVHHDRHKWSYQLLTGRLDDLADYQWRVVPIDRAGNDGTAIAIDAERIVRIPDAPDFEITFNAGPKTVTFSAAA